jgi:hypothetical protein
MRFVAVVVALGALALVGCDDNSDGYDFDGPEDTIDCSRLDEGGWCVFPQG